MAVITITAPAVEPVTVAEFKSHARIEYADEDAGIEKKITAAREYAERYLGFPFISTEFELVLDTFPRGPLKLPAGRLQSVTSVKYVAPDTGLEVTLTAGTDYEVDTYSVPGWIAPAASGWPTPKATINAVRVRYVAGYGATAADVPAAIREAILQIASSYFENRESVSDVSMMSVPHGAESTLDNFRSYDWE
ncbi:MAG: head-tail connector protein [Hoeflea sp.]|uniref:head-tail connector protein n=1 Tax=Hoeflea sp. TaxID=1940281 RepID=UPI001E0C7FD3|nr:head-tail connector protein [Hoeflea sp.]MBU4529713.1 head-tail connector protein [Alphaproteobacteria bacterium]MBU4543274.1 head-tail connector protein [Alphaproteobacteria bacterium]MBU4552461.1 head-tail connector protein [Alphaproteobacteria bacterium]MBV1723477.1 head-tail connector protein [Hoeflea sp.]MBV1762926.1 head-tail connector protein [Hoeflea sp.]